jgi:hypothetical protein
VVDGRRRERGAGEEARARYEERPDKERGVQLDPAGPGARRGLQGTFSLCAQNFLGKTNLQASSLEGKDEAASTS